MSIIWNWILTNCCCGYRRKTNNNYRYKAFFIGDSVDTDSRKTCLLTKQQKQQNMRQYSIDKRDRELYNQSSKTFPKLNEIL